MNGIIRNIELILSAVGLAMIWLVPEALAGGDHSWKTTAVVATIVGALHGIIFWIIRRRQRLLRNELIEEIQLMLKDQINSKLTVINLSAEQAKTEEHRNERLRQVQETVMRISQLLAALSDESLQRWKDRYPNLFQKPRSHGS